MLEELQNFGWNKRFVFDSVYLHSDIYGKLPISWILFSEHDDRTAPQFRNRKGRGSHKGRSYDRSRRDRQRGSHSGGFGGPGPRSRLEDTDGDVTMSDSSQDNSSQHRL